MTGISAVVPCYNAADTIAATLHSLQATDQPPDEIVCVDDGSADATTDVVARTSAALTVPCRLIRLPHNGGAAAARNRGAEAATGDLLLFLDADVVVRPETVGRLCRRIEEPRVSVVVALYEPASEHGGALADFQSLLAHVTFRDLDADDLPYLGTQCVLLPRRLLLELGGFAEHFGGASVEDLEFGIRCRARGHRIALATSAPIAHNRPYGFHGFSANYLAKARGLARLVRSHGARSAALGSGYSSWRNLVSVLLLGAGLVSVAVVAGVPQLRWAGGVAAILCVAGVVAGWRDFVAEAFRRDGIGRAVLFTVLRAYVTLVGVAGVVLAATERSPKGGSGGRGMTND